jgi:hypothetical protein
MITDVNPFVYSHPLAPEDIIDRDQETHDLLAKAVGGHYVRLYAPRKYGKTSLLKRALLEGERHEGLIPILVDLYRVVSIADVTIRFERAYAAALKGPIQGKIEAWLQQTGLGLSLGAFGISAKIQLNPRDVEPLAALHTLLDLPQRLEEQGAYRAFVALDEFQDVNNVPNLDGIMRSHFQHHAAFASYVFAGSEPGLMRQLFEDRARPLYGSAVPMRLGRLPHGDLAAYVANRFAQTDRAVGEALTPLLNAADGHPQRSMLLAYRLWEQVEQGDTATLDSWARAYETALAELDPEFDAAWRKLSVNHQKTLRAVIAGNGSPYRASVLARLDLQKTNAQWSLKQLIATADLEAEGRRQRVVDPLFAAWINRINFAGMPREMEDAAPAQAPAV